MTTVPVAPPRRECPPFRRGSCRPARAVATDALLLVSAPGEYRIGSGTTELIFDGRGPGPSTARERQVGVDATLGTRHYRCVVTLREFRQMAPEQRGVVADRHPVVTAVFLSAFAGIPLFLGVLLVGGVLPALACGALGIVAGTVVGVVYQRRRPRRGGD